MMQQAADYLEKVSLSNPDRQEYDFKTLPRPKGKATKVDHHRVRPAAQRSAAA